MALLRYLQRTDGLPDPRGSLSSAVPRQAIARANQEVQAAVDSEAEVREKGKRGAYNRYSPRDRAAEIQRSLSYSSIFSTYAYANNFRC